MMDAIRFKFDGCAPEDGTVIADGKLAERIEKRITKMRLIIGATSRDTRAFITVLDEGDGNRELHAEVMCLDVTLKLFAGRKW